MWWRRRRRRRRWNDKESPGIACGQQNAGQLAHSHVESWCLCVWKMELKCIFLIDFLSYIVWSDIRFEAAGARCHKLPAPIRLQRHCLMTEVWQLSWVSQTVSQLSSNHIHTLLMKTTGSDLECWSSWNSYLCNSSNDNVKSMLQLPSAFRSFTVNFSKWINCSGHNLAYCFSGCFRQLLSALRVPLYITYPASNSRQTQWATSWWTEWSTE